MHLLDEPRDVRPGLSDQVGYLAAAKGSRARGNRGREAPQVVQSSRLQSGAEVIACPREPCRHQSGSAQNDLETELVLLFLAVSGRREPALLTRR